MNKQIIALGTVIVIGLVSSLFLLHKHMQDLYEFHNTSDKIIMIPQEMRYYDEVLTMSANMAAFTHVLEWIERYNEAIGSLELSIKKARKAFPQVAQHLDEIDRINKKLIVLEAQSIELVKQYRFEEAQKVLLSQNYNENKVLYTKNLEEIIKVIESSIHTFEEESQHKFELLILIITLVILSTMFLSTWFLITLRKKNHALKNSQESLDYQHRLLQKIIDIVPVRMFWKDKEGVYLGANQLFLADAGLSDVSQIIGKTDYEMTWKKDAERFREDDAAVRESGVPRIQYEEDQPKEDGSCIHLLTSKVPLRDVHDEVIGILGIYDDITGQKVLEKEAKEKDEQLFKQAKHAQMGEMIAMIAHQWRQPLSSISATVSTLQVKRTLGRCDDESLDEQLEQISGFTQHLSKTIDDFRGFFKEEKSELTTTLEKVSEESLGIIKPTFNASHIAISTQYLCNESLPTYPNELKQVLINLLKNAQEVLDEREVKEKKIEIKTYKDDSKYYWEVHDNAGGIPEEVMDRIFEPYFTTKEALNGTGLGLYMSKQIIEEHLHGRLTGVNKDDGASFIIELSGSGPKSS